MALVNPYCSVQELRDQFGDDGSALATAHLERAINATSRAIDRYCRRRFWLDTAVATRTYLVEDPLLAYVDDIGSRTGLIVKTSSDGVTYSTTLTVDTDFILEPRNADAFDTDTFDAYAFWQIRMVGSRFFTVHASRPTLQVTARHGWSEVPDDVAEACILKAASLFKRREAPFGVAGFGDFGVVRIRRDDDVATLLESYRIPRTL